MNLIKTILQKTSICVYNEKYKKFQFFSSFSYCHEGQNREEVERRENKKFISLCIVSKTHEIERLLGGCILNSSCFEISTQKI